MSASTGEFRLPILERDVLRTSDLPPLEPQDRQDQPCRQCWYRRERNGVCSNCGRPKRKD